MKDLNQLLRSWEPEVPEPASFRRNVWRRIAEEQARPEFGLAGWIEHLLVAICRPRLAVVAATVAIGVGIGIGTLSARSDSGADAYLRSVNPYAQARS
jgi:hypothetical protein